MAKQLFGNLKHGLAFIISAPSGTGKTTIIKKIVSKFSFVVESVSLTTRLPREGEINGVDYFFVSENEFKKKIALGNLLEYVKLFGTYYGTSKEHLLGLLSQGKHVILDIDTEGALKIMKTFPAVFVFLHPPSMQELERRLCRRKTESKECIQERLSQAFREIERAVYYHYQIVNDDIDITCQVLESIIIAEEYKTSQIGYIK